MTVVYRLLPCGIYVCEYERLPGEYADLVRRAEERTIPPAPARIPETVTTEVETPGQAARRWNGSYPEKRA